MHLQGVDDVQMLKAYFFLNEHIYLKSVILNHFFYCTICVYHDMFAFIAHIPLAQYLFYLSIHPFVPWLVNHAQVGKCEILSLKKYAFLEGR